MDTVCPMGSPIEYTLCPMGSPVEYPISGPWHALRGNHGRTSAYASDSSSSGVSMEQSVRPSVECPTHLTMNVYHAIPHGRFRFTECAVVVHVPWETPRKFPLNVPWVTMSYTMEQCFCGMINGPNIHADIVECHSCMACPMVHHGQDHGSR